MAGEKGGRDFLLEVETSPDTFELVGGLRTKSLTFNNEEIDVTNHDSDEFREILDETGIRSMSASGDGVYKNVATIRLLELNAKNGTLTKFRLIRASTATQYESLFKITSFEGSGGYNEENQFSLSLESSGEISITQQS